MFIFRWDEWLFWWCCISVFTGKVIYFLEESMSGAGCSRQLTEFYLRMRLRRDMASCSQQSSRTYQWPHRYLNLTGKPYPVLYLLHVRSLLAVIDRELSEIYYLLCSSIVTYSSPSINDTTVFVKSLADSL